MNYPVDTIADTLAFAIRGEYDKRVYTANLGKGGGHYPATSVCVVYQLRRRDGADDCAPLPQGGVEQLPRRWLVADAGDRRGDDMGGVTK